MANSPNDEMSLPAKLRDWADSNLRGRYGPGMLRIAADELERLKLEEQRWRTGFADECRANDRLRASLKKIIDEGDFTAPEGMKRIAQEALKS